MYSVLCNYFACFTKYCLAIIKYNEVHVIIHCTTMLENKSKYHLILRLLNWISEQLVLINKSPMLQKYLCYSLKLHRSFASAHCICLK